MDTINQPSANPTNKLTAATAAVAVWSIVYSIGGLFVRNLYPEWYDEPTMMTINTAVPTIVAFLAGYLTKDRPNIVVVMDKTEEEPDDGLAA